MAFISISITKNHPLILGKGGFGRQLADWLSAEGWGEAEFLGIETARQCSAARCARVSYLNHDGTTPNVTKDLETFAKLAGDPNGPPHPLHASPMEHQATPDRLSHPEKNDSWQFPTQHGNFRGWRQFRKMLSGEQIAKFSPPS